MPAKYKLTYFEARGRAEVTRWLFILGKTDYTDERLTQEAWQKRKPSTPFGQLPILEVDGTIIAQSNTIARLVAKKTGYAGKDEQEEAKANSYVDGCEDMLKPLFAMAFAKDEDKPKLKEKWDAERDGYLANYEKFLTTNDSGFLVGDKLTWADLTLVNSLSWVENLDGGDIYGKFPKLKKLKERVTSLPPIAKWIKERPETKF